MPTYDLLLKGGTIMDGQRTPRFTGDIAIVDGRIAQIGRVAESRASRVFDANDLIVCPGFVDLHTHYDAQVFWDPYCTISGWHGVTSVAIGNCGFGFAPCRPEDRRRSMLTMERNEAIRATTMEAGMPWDWETIPEYFDSLDRTPKGVNLLAYTGLNPVMAYVMGVEAAKSRPASPEERARICAILSEAMDAGSCGISAQLLGEDSPQMDYDGTPMITDVMSRDDLLTFAGVLAEKGRGFIQVIGASRRFTEQLCEASGRPVIWNTLVADTDQHGINHGVYKKVIEWLEEANARGNRVFAQAFTVRDSFQFTLEDWNLFDTDPAWRAITLGSVEERARKMRDPELRRAVRESYVADSFVTGAVLGSLENFTVAHVYSDENRPFEGLSVGEIGQKLDKHPIDAMLDVALADDLRTLFCTPPLEPNFEVMREVANSKFALPGISDGGAHMKFMTMGCYPTEFLTLLVRDNDIMDLEQAHWRLSAYPALAAGFVDRGTLRVGAPADIVAYDYDALALGPVERRYDFPAGDWRLSQKAEGYRLTVVNGEITFEDGECTGAAPGVLLRHGRTA